MKKVHAFLAVVALMICQKGFAMEAANQTLRLEIANQTSDDITLVRGDQIITIPSYDETIISVEPFYVEPFYETGRVFISTKSGSFNFVWLTMDGRSSFLRVENEATGKNESFRNPRNPLIVFEEGQNFPQVHKER